ncbi:MAG: hypothetical protein KC731_15835 [Myxococcales bacterium]|nr:hypothetical protein [Myxococcales bacterium]
MLWRDLSSWPKNSEVDRDSMAIESLYTVLTESVAADLHFSAYARPDLPVRLSKEVLDHPVCGAGIPMRVLCFDIDCPAAHRASGGSLTEATPGWREKLRQRVTEVEQRVPGGICYDTRKGARLLWALPEPRLIHDDASADAWTLFYLRNALWLAREFDIVADATTSYWNCLFRAPFATRSDSAVPENRAFTGDPDRIGVWSYQPTAASMNVDLDTAMRLAAAHVSWAQKLRRLTGRRRSRPRKANMDRSSVRSSATFAPPVPTHEISRALLPVVTDVDDGRHDLYLCLAGTLCQAGFASADTLQVVEELARGAGDPKVADRRHDAATTIANFEKGQPVRGFGSLHEAWPELVDPLVEVLGDVGSEGFGAMHREFIRRPCVPTMTVAKAEVELRRELESARQRGGVTLVRASTGLGKTTAAMGMAARGIGKVALVVPTNEQAEESLRRLRAMGVSASRRQGLLADASAGPGCVHPEVAEQFSNSGLSVPRHLCAPCSHRASCPIRRGHRHGQADVLVTNHALLGVALDHVGKDGLLVIDETPSLFEVGEISYAGLRATHDALVRGAFIPSFATAVLPIVLAALNARLGRECFPANTRASANELHQNDPSFRAVLGRGLSQIDLDLPSSQPPGHLVVALLEHAVLSGTGGAEPPLRHDVVRGLTSGRSALSVETVVTATRTLKTLARLMGWGDERSDAQPVVGGGAGRRTARLRTLFSNVSLQRALSRAGATIVLDATVDAVDLASLSGGRVNEVTLNVADAAPLTRTAVFWSRGSRRWMLKAGKPNWSFVGPVVADVLTRVAAAQMTNVVLVTHKPVADALRSGHVPHRRASEELVRFTAGGGRVTIQHYGAVRGKNIFEGVPWEDVDALVTIGDPIPNVGQMELEARVLRLNEKQAGDRPSRRAEVELAQAHGRLRAPRRTRPALALHYGRLIPMTWTTSNAHLATLKPGRPRSTMAMEVTELMELISEAGGVKALAQQVGVARSTIYDLVNGTRPISAETARRLRAPSDASC